jgi:N-acetylmuramoyl-L-alanine amidase
MSYMLTFATVVLLALPGSVLADEAVDVVLDPGHGGSNTGSPGRGDVLEKHVTLALAKAVRRELEDRGVRVAMTRTKDEYLPIRARARAANTVRPLCFISLHTNASPDHGKLGVETYLLSREAVDIHARREGKRAESDAEALIAEQHVLADARASLDLARRIQLGLLAHEEGAYAPVDRGVRQAPHDVLGDAEVPAVLVEAGFLDHPIEGRYLASKEGQAETARRIAVAVDGFVKARRAPVVRPVAALAEPPITLTRR